MYVNVYLCIRNTYIASSVSTWVKTYKVSLKQQGSCGVYNNRFFDLHSFQTLLVVVASFKLGQSFGCYCSSRTDETLKDMWDLTLILALISNYIHYKMWNKFTYPFPNGATVEVWEWMINLIVYLYWAYAYFSMLEGSKSIHVTKRVNLTRTAPRKTWKRHKHCNFFWEVIYFEILCVLVNDRVYLALLYFQGQYWQQYDKWLSTWWRRHME